MEQKSTTVELVKKRILSNELEPEQRINESKLAEEIGISRTPLREALNSLQSEGLVTNDKGKGFYVAPLSKQDALELYSLIGTLESAMLKDIGVQAMSNIIKLKKLDEKIKENPSDFELIERLSNEFHFLLLSNGKNQRMKKLINQYWEQIERYENVCNHQLDYVQISVLQHNKIVEALECMDVELAANLLLEHWRFCGQSIADML